MLKLLKKRVYDAELMDDLDSGGPEMAQTLKELESVNRQLGGYTPVIESIEELVKDQAPKRQHVSIADLGCGGGDTLRSIALWGQDKNIFLSLTGIDANAFIVEYARRRSLDFPEIEFRQENIFSTAFAKEEFDIIIACLFCHHFNEEQLVRMFRLWYSQARIGIIINDLHRHPVAYYSIKYITKFFSRSGMIRNDAPLSVERGFTKKELATLLEAAGIRQCKIRWRWAFRWQVVIRKISL
jgi:2-polyprenyl-3-methyl-5-hydroxy-6-metoxy-1,4-benzoquinol methylase